MYRHKKISLIIPCRNEADSIVQLLDSVPKYVDEVIVVDNNSTDETARVARKRGAIVVSERRVDKWGIGYGYAHMKGMFVASGDLIVTMDGDGTYPMTQIGEVIDYMVESRLDFVACSRFPLTNGKAISWFRKLGVWILNTQVKVLYQYPLQDILSGMWVMNRKAMQSLHLKEGGWDLSPEIKLEALMVGEVAFGQYHINHTTRDNGASKQQLWVTGFNHLKYIGWRWLFVDSWIASVMNQTRNRLDMAVLKRFSS